MAPVSKTRKIPPQEWIQDYFSPIVGILSCDDTEILCRKNNLTFVELLQPFSKLLADVTVKDPEGVNHPVSNLNVLFQDYRRDPSRQVNSKLMYSMVAEITDEPFIKKTFNRGEDVLEAPGFTPWFDVYMKLYLQSIPILEHEFIRNHLGVIFAVAANNSNPVETLKNLSQLQYRQQHENKSSTYPQYISTNVLKYYVLVHDAYETDEGVAHDAFHQIQQAFGSSFCHLLQINSRTQKSFNDPSEVIVPIGGNPAVADYWFNNISHRFCNVELRLFSNISVTPSSTTPILQTKVASSGSDVSAENNDLLHPLATPEKIDSPIEASPVPKLTKVEHSNLALHLTPNDIDRIKIFVREFVIRGLIPYVERQMRMFSDIVNNRKSRSLFSGAKRWFGQAKPGAASGTSVIYGKDAPELQIRKLGDLFFMIKLYKHAYNCYYTAKKDYQIDEAWNYYAGAAEMSALSQFMQNDNSKKYPAHYMEDSITKYLQVCQLPDFAIRASFFDALCLKFNGMFLESASSYIKMINETKDLRSALLLEQASYCFLLSNPALIRKYAFHIILAGFRFSKCGQKKHSSRAYQQGFQIYKGRGWSLSEDHILYTLGHQSLLLKEPAVAANLFNQLLAMTSPSINPLQQMCHLREFFIVHHMREKEDKTADVLTIPKIHSQQIIIDASGLQLAYDQLISSNAGSDWQNLEKLISEQLRPGEIGTQGKTSLQIFGPFSNNSIKPTVVVGEKIRVLVPVENPFQTPFLMKKICLLWKFVEGDSTYTNDTSEISHDAVKVDVIDSLIVDKMGRAVLELGITPNKTNGELTILGLTFGIKAQFPQSEATDYVIRGKQYFEVKGPRLNATKEQKTSVVYANDFRLNLNVISSMPRLEISLSNIPECLSSGEVRPIDVQFSNTGGNSLCNLYMIHHHPGTFALHSQKKMQGKSIFPFPVFTDQSLRQIAENGLSKDIPIDMIPVNLTSQCLEPGQNFSTSLLIRGPELSGTHKISLYFYYEAPSDPGSRQVKYRMVRTEFSLKSSTSVTVTALRKRAMLRENCVCQTILVTVSNSSSLSITPRISVSQISLISHRSSITQLLSENKASVVEKSESLVYALKTVVDNTMSDTGIKVSNVQMEDEKLLNLESSPHFDFVKSFFTFRGKKKEPFLTRDVMVVIWSLGGNSPSMGFLTIQPKDDLENTDSKVFDFPDSGSSDIARSTCDSVDIPEPVHKQPCVTTVQMKKIWRHDFTTGTGVLIPFEVQIKNSGTSPGKAHFKANKDWQSMEGAECRFLGCSRTSTQIDTGDTKKFLFHLMVTCAGVYDCDGLRFQFSNPCDDNPDDDELIPLRIGFIVKQEEIE